MIGPRPRGFTLIEVLIALVLVAAALTLGYASVRNAALGAERLHERVLAEWVADNRSAEVRIGALEAGDRERIVTEALLGRTYAARVSARDPDGIVEIVVTASAGEETLASATVTTP
jgi:general secretion pathway protein I